jgi:glycosyltransferase involved in cell wall biosynthesis
MADTLRILRSCFSRSLGGLELSAVGTSEMLHQRGHRVWFACPPGSRIEAECARRQMPVLPLDVRGYAHPLLAGRLAAFLRRNDVDLLHTELSRDLPTLVAAIRMSGRSLPLILTKQMGSYIMKRDPLHRITYAHVDRVIAISTVLQKNVIETTPMSPDRVVVLHHGVDTDLFSPERVDRWRVRREFGIEDDATLIGFVGRFSPGKGHEDLLHALHLLTPAHPRLRCLIVGEASVGESDYEQKVRTLTARMGLDTVVTYAGFRRNIPEVMATFDLFAFPSHAEAFGIVLIEAMAMERAVVSTNCDGVLDIVVDGETGVTAPSKDPVRFAAGLDRLIRDPSLRQRMGSAGRRRVAEMFNQSIQIKRLEGIYREVLREKGERI